MCSITPSFEAHTTIVVHSSWDELVHPTGSPLLLSIANKASSFLAYSAERFCSERHETLINGRLFCLFLKGGVLPLKAGGSLTPALFQQNDLSSSGGTPGDAGNVDSSGSRAGGDHLSLALGPFGMAAGEARLCDIPRVRLL